MQDLIDSFRDRQKDSASQVPPALEEVRAAFAPGGRLHPVPDDVLVKGVTAGGVPAHWLAAPGADAGRVLLFLHGGGYELGSVRSAASWPPGWDEPAGCGCCSPNIAWPPSIPSPPPLLVQVGTADLLLSDSERLATAAAGAGIDVTLQIGAGLPHVYQLLLGTPEAAEATEQIGKFLRARVR
jgi:monoterpene epsilon-lactone hydrolase